MDQPNPYASPHSDLTRPTPTAVDTTGPFDPKGRFTRLSWLAWSLVLGFVSGGLNLIMGAIGVAMLPPPGANAVAFAPFLVVLIPQLALVVLGWLMIIRRFHDFDASGWWSLTLVLPLFNLITFLVLLFKRGDDLANRFGPPRPTPDWERVLGIIYILLVVVGLVGGIIVAIAMPSLLNDQLHAMHA